MRLEEVVELPLLRLLSFLTDGAAFPCNICFSCAAELPQKLTHIGPRQNAHRVHECRASIGDRVSLFDNENNYQIRTAGCASLN